MLEDLGRALSSAIAGLSQSSPVDEAALDLSLRSIASALLSSDVNVLLVKRLRDSVKALVLPQLIEIAKKSGDSTAGAKGKAIIQKAVFDELVTLVDPGENATPPFKPVKGKPSVLMLVGLQGAGKTTTCTKLAVHYQKRGLKVALVCADTFRAGAFDQLKQNAVKARVPFFGSYTETDPVSIASQGVSKFRSERFDLIILDTSGRHRQESELFEEMVEIGKAVKPDCTIMVLDGAIGQAAESQSRAFKEASDFGAIIVTKLDGHAKGGGAISAVAATSTPIIFLGTGEHLHDLEAFSPRPFISKMLGMGDMQGLMEHAKEMQEMNPGNQEKMMKSFEKGEFSVRDMREQMMNVMNMGPISKLTSMIPGMSGLSGLMGGNEEQIAKKQKRMIFIFDSMTAEELDSDGSLFLTPSPHSPVASTSAIVPAATTPSKAKGKNGKELAPTPTKKAVETPSLPEGTPREPNARVLRVARGSGTSVQEVEEVLGQHQAFKAMAKNAGGKSGWMGKMAAAQQAQARAGAAGRPAMGMPDMNNLSPAQLQKMSSMMPQGMRDQMAAPGAMEAAMKMMGGMGAGGMGGFDMSKLMGMMGGGAPS